MLLQGVYKPHRENWLLPSLLRRLRLAVGGWYQQLTWDLLLSRPAGWWYRLSVAWLYLAGPAILTASFLFVGWQSSAHSGITQQLHWPGLQSLLGGSPPLLLSPWLKGNWSRTGED